MEIRLKRLLRLLAALSIVCQVQVRAQAVADNTPVPANPARPTVSTPATLTPVGYLQFENGVLIARDSQEFSTRNGIEQVTKLTVSPRIEFLLQSEPLVWSTHSEHPATRPGEVFLGVQGVLLNGTGAQPTVAISYLRRLHQSPAPEMDTGTFRQGGILLISENCFGFHIDANAIATEQVEEPVRRAQYAQTLSISHPLSKTTISGEIWHFTQPLTNSNAVGNLWAVSYPFKPNLVADAGFNRGLTSTSTQWEEFAGFTYLLPKRLWRGRK